MSDIPIKKATFGRPEFNEYKKAEIDKKKEKDGNTYSHPSANVYSKVGAKHEKFVPSTKKSDEELLENQQLPIGKEFEDQNADELFSERVDVSGGDVDENDKLRIDSFEYFYNVPGLRANISKKQLRHPTLVQQAVFPIIMLKNDFDLIVRAETGSGKTAAFLLPIIRQLYLQKFDQKNQRIKKSMEKYGTSYPNSSEKPHTPIKSLILAPTRELAQQIYTDASILAHRTGLSVIVTYGEFPIDKNVEELELAKANDGYCDILVATMGRFLQFMKDGFIELEMLKFLIIDEADKMLESNFLREVYFVKSHLNQLGIVCQTMMFSATIDHNVLEYANQLLRPGYFFVSIASSFSAARHMINIPPKTITQKFIEVRKYKRVDALLKILTKCSKNQTVCDADGLDWLLVPKTIVFCNGRRTTNWLALKLSLNRVRAIPLNGDRSQKQRQEALDDFIKNGLFDVLIATNAAARGLNSSAVLIVNFELPLDFNQYVHRVGRTGRLGNHGYAFSFVDEDRLEDRRIASHIVQYLTETKQPVPEFLNTIASTYMANVNVKGEQSCVSPQHFFEDEELQDHNTTSTEDEIMG